MIGYDKFLFILPFDHRGTFEKGMFGISESELTPEIEEKIKKEKTLIYEGFKKSVVQKVPKEFSAILVDEQFGADILLDARSNGFITIQTTEKSGQKEFDFEYGDDFGQHLDKYRPTFAKVLVRFNPQDPEDSRERQKERLKKISDFCHEIGYKFLAEILVEPTAEQLSKLGNNKESFDKEERPALAINVFEEFQDYGIEPDIWKVEGVDKREEYEALVRAARRNGRDNVGIVILGRGAGKEQVDNWIRQGAGVEGIVGFAVGRTVFWDAIMENNQGKISDEETIRRISENFIYYYDLFMSERKNS